MELREQLMGLESPLCLPECPMPCSTSGMLCESETRLILAIVHDWGNEPCPHWTERKKRCCDFCWKKLYEGQ